MTRDEALVKARNNAARLMTDYVVIEVPNDFLGRRYAAIRATSWVELSQYFPEACKVDDVPYAPALRFA